MKRIWVIELKENDEWKTTVGVGLTKADAIRELKQYWEANMPDDKFRIVKYVPSAH